MRRGEERIDLFLPPVGPLVRCQDCRERENRPGQVSGSSCPSLLTPQITHLSLFEGGEERKVQFKSQHQTLLIKLTEDFLLVGITSPFLLNFLSSAGNVKIILKEIFFSLLS